MILIGDHFNIIPGDESYTDRQLGSFKKLDFKKLGKGKKGLEVIFSLMHNVMYLDEVRGVVPPSALHRLHMAHRPHLVVDPSAMTMRMFMFINNFLFNQFVF